MECVAVQDRDGEGPEQGEPRRHSHQSNQGSNSHLYTLT
jgi:hypothetical protein